MTIAVGIRTVSEAKNAGYNQYGELEVNFEEAIRVAYPEIEFWYREPGCHGGNPDIEIKENTLILPSGTYSSRKHFHSCGHGIMAIENARDCRLNLAGKPLFLLTGRAYNGDYRSLTKTYFLFGQNEDRSFFLHKVRPKVGESGDLEVCRRWMWGLKPGEILIARQGDCGFIAKEKPCGKVVEGNLRKFGNHKIEAQEWRSTAGGRWYALNPKAIHPEHDQVILKGWVEIRLAKAWRGSFAD